MTVRINFLPRSYQPPKRAGVREWAIAAAVGVAVMATGFYYMTAFAATSRLEKQARTDQVKLTAVKTQLASAAEVRSREERVAKAERELKSLAGHPWSPLLLTLRDLTPQRVIWSSLSVQDNSISLNGSAHGLADVAQLLAGLVDNSQVERVELHYVNEQGTEVTLSLKQGDSPAGALPAEKPAKAAQVETEDGSQKGIEPYTLRQMDFEMVIFLVQGDRGRAG